MESEGTSNDPQVIKKNTAPIQLKKIVSQLLSQKSARLSFKCKEINERQKNPSNIWSRYKQAVIDERPICIWKCDHCTALFIYESTSGHSHLGRHNCQTPKSVGVVVGNGNQTITKFVAKLVPQDSLRCLNKDITLGLAKDLHPMNHSEREGFRYMAQSLIDFGARFGSQPVANVIQHRTTHKRSHLPKICEDIQQDIKETLNNAPSFPKFGFSKDMWTEKTKNQEFLSLSIHFIDKNWKLRSPLLGLETFNENKTTENIRKECASILENYFDESKVDSIIGSSTSTTDGGANMLNVFPNRLPCFCHKVNLTIHWTFNDKAIPTAEEIQKRVKNGRPYAPKYLFNVMEHCPEIYVSLKGVKELVTYFKQAKLNYLLPTTLKQEVPTRWNSTLIMLESYVASANEIHSVLVKMQQVKRCMSINMDLIEEVIEFLKPFRECSEVLSGDKYPTIQLVALWCHYLQDHVKPNDSDSTEMKKLREQAAHCCREYLTVEHGIYFVGCILDPRYKTLQFAGKRDKRESLILLQKYMDEQPAELTVAAVPPPKDVRPSKFDKFKDPKCHSKEDRELDRYIAHSFSIEDDEKFDILEFWSRAAEYPILQKVARWLLAIPASEATDERVFSDGGVAVPPKSTALSAKTLGAVVFVHRNAEL